MYEMVTIDRSHEYASIDGNKIKMCVIFLSPSLFLSHFVNLQAFIFISWAMESVAGQIYCVEKLRWLSKAKVKDRPLNTRAPKST